VVTVVVIETVLGNVGDPEWSERLSAADVDLLRVDQWEAQKSRFRKTTAKGAEVAISLDRGTYIRDGDVLLWEAQAAAAIVARIDLRDVMIVHLEDLARLAPEAAMRTCVELGHAMGNQHWPALVKGSLVYVPLTVDRKVMASVMDTHRFEGIRYEFVPGREAVLQLAPHESRRLFGGAEGPVHSHTHESYALVDAETGRVYGRPPVRAHAHSGTDAHSHASPAKPASANDHGE
jgi:urease accessory protein